MREPVSLEEYALAADQRLRDLPDRPLDLSELEIAPHISGSLVNAAPGDSISSIMGSSEPGAIGAFIQANDLTAPRSARGKVISFRSTTASPRGARGRWDNRGLTGLIGQMLVLVPGLGYLAGTGGGIAASWLADRYLPTREQFGRGLQKAIKTYGEQPYSGML